MLISHVNIFFAVFAFFFLLVGVDLANAKDGDKKKKALNKVLNPNLNPLTVLLNPNPKCQRRSKP